MQKTGTLKLKIHVVTKGTMLNYIHLTITFGSSKFLPRNILLKLRVLMCC